MSQEVDVVGDEGRAALLKVNPKATVPTMLVDGVAFTENVATLLYIAHSAPKSGLLPATSIGEAQCISRMAWLASTVHVAFRKIYRPNRFSTDTSAHDGIRAFGKDECWSYLEAVDQMLGDKTWMMGEHFSLVDCHAFIFCRWGILSKFPVQTLPSLSRFSERMLARPSVQSALAREDNGQ